VFPPKLTRIDFVSSLFPQPLGIFEAKFVKKKTVGLAISSILIGLRILTLQICLRFIVCGRNFISNIFSTKTTSLTEGCKKNAVSSSTEPHPSRPRFGASHSWFYHYNYSWILYWMNSSNYLVKKFLDVGSRSLLRRIRVLRSEHRINTPQSVGIGPAYR